jgi:hypothetical protein
VLFRSGSPIIIIKNGQNIIEKDPWVPVVENINEDKSSIYITSTQQIPLDMINKTGSYAKSKLPESVSSYSKEQIILNSGRLVFNAKNSDIILGSNKSIHLLSNTSINMDASNEIVLDSPKVYLGSAIGEEGIQLQSLVKGENFNTLLGEISSFLLSLSVYFQTATDSTNAPIVSLQQASTKAKVLGKSIQKIVENKDLLSKQVKTI